MGDSLDPSRLPEVYAKDRILQYANIPPVLGLDELKSFFGPILEKLGLMHHEISYFGVYMGLAPAIFVSLTNNKNLDLVGDKLYQACRITYRMNNDPEEEETKIPAFGVFQVPLSGKDAGKMKKVVVYLDPSPLMAALARVG